MPTFAMIQPSSVVSASAPSVLAACVEILPASATWEGLKASLDVIRLDRRDAKDGFVVLRTISLAFAISPFRSANAPVIVWPAIFSSFCLSARTPADSTRNATPERSRAISPSY